MSFAVQKEVVKSTRVDFTLSGKFTYGNRINHQHINEYLSHQILLVKNSLFEIYDVLKINDESNRNDLAMNYKYNYLLEYKVFGEITGVEKFRMNKTSLSQCDAIVLILDYAKVAILEYDPNYFDFKILCLYNLENENLSNGKKFYKDNMQVLSSVIYNSLFFLSNDVTITVLLRKYANFYLTNHTNHTHKENNHNHTTNIGIVEEEQIKYLDTISGEKYFHPSFYINFHNYGVSKIIKFYIFNKENENLDYHNQIFSFNENENIVMYVLYKESGFLTLENETSNNIVSNPNFYKSKINLGLVMINRRTHSLESFDVVFENLDQNSFSLFSIYSGKTIVVLAPYCVQIVNLEQKICHNLILNPIYVGVFHREYTLKNINTMRGDISHVNLSMDLRGGGYLVITNTQWVFTNSKGLLYVFSFENNLFNVKIDQIHLQKNNEMISSLEVPYKDIVMPFPGVFFLSSLFSDPLFVIYDGVNMNYCVGNVMTNLSPIINFVCVLDRFQTKFIFTSGYNKSGQINFYYDKLFYDINFATQEYQEISYLKSLNFKGEMHSKYLLVGFKNGKSLIYEIGKTFENISEKVSLYQNSRILNAIVLKIKIKIKNDTKLCDDIDLNQNVNSDTIYSHLEVILIVYENYFQIFNQDMKLLTEIPLKDLIDLQSTDMIEDKIRQCRLSENSIIFNTYYDKFVLCLFETREITENIHIPINDYEIREKNEFNQINETSNFKKIEIVNDLIFKYLEISTDLMKSNQKILKFDVNSKKIDDFTYLVLYRENGVVEIFDIMDFTREYNHSDKDSQNGSQIKPIFENNLITELPVILSDTRKEENRQDFQSSYSDLTQKIIINNNIPHIDLLTTPEEIFFDLLETKVVFSIVFKNSSIIYYEVFFKNKNTKNYQILSSTPATHSTFSPCSSEIKMKKFYIDYIENIDYRELFYSEMANLYVRFSNINDKSGVLLNIKGNQKMLFEINGMLKFLDFENNIKIKRSFSAFSDLSKEGCLNGFVFYENGYFTIANIPKNYEIKECGLIKRVPLNHFPVNLNYLIIGQGNMVMYYYITIEKELKLTSIKTSGGQVTVNKFIYYLCLRNDDSKLLDQIEFPAGDVIVESRIVELLSLHKVKTKYIAVGVNLSDEKGEEITLKAKLHLYNIENGKFVNVLDSELRGVISMIHSIDGILIISEGSKIYLYQYVPLTNEIKKLSVIENKHLVTCSKVQSKFIITGDIFESATWIVFKHDQDINNSSIYILGKDQNNYRTSAIDFWIDDTGENYKTGCVLADDEKNLHIFIINPELNSPNRLIEVADLHIGKKLTELRYYSYNNKSFVYYSTSDGSIGLIKPISKLSHDKLGLLSEFLYNHLPFRAGLNPKNFYSTYLKNSLSFKKEKGNIVDLNILNYFLYLPITTQKLIAKNVVLSRETIIQNINEINN